MLRNLKSNLKSELKNILKMLVKVRHFGKATGLQRVDILQSEIHYRYFSIKLSAL